MANWKEMFTPQVTKQVCYSFLNDSTVLWTDPALGHDSSKEKGGVSEV